MIKYYTIRFHKQHDADIVSFIKYNHFNVVKAVKAALTAYAMRQYFYMNINDYIYDRIPKEKNKYVYQLKLDDIRDADVIWLMDKIKPGYKNFFIKNVLRIYLFSPVSAHFLYDPNDFDDFYNRFGFLDDTTMAPVYIISPEKDDISDADVSICEEEKADKPIIEDNGFDDLTDLFTSLIS